MNENNITPGDRVSLLPHTDTFMRGDRYGTARSVSLNSVVLRTDSGRRLVVAPSSVAKVPLHIRKG